MPIRFRSPLEESEELGKLWPRVREAAPEARRPPERVPTRERYPGYWPPAEIRPTEAVTLPPTTEPREIDRLLEAAYNAALAAHQEAQRYADALMRDYTAAVARSEITGGEFRRFKGGISDFTTKTNTALGNTRAAITSLNKLKRLVRSITERRGLGTPRIAVRA